MVIIDHVNLTFSFGNENVCITITLRSFIMNDKWDVEPVKERIKAQYGGKIPRRFRLPYFGGKSRYSYSGPSRVEVNSELADDVVESEN